MRTGLPVLTWALAVTFAVTFAGDVEPVRAASAEQDYVLNCMGCHQADGSGSSGRVPALVGIDRFLATAEGRSYVIRVPGVANSGLSDERLTALLNWTIARFGRSSFRPYTKEEVAPLRGHPFLNAIAARRRMMSRLEKRAARGEESPDAAARIRK